MYNNQNKIKIFDPLYISGLCDAEACFFLNLNNKFHPRFSFSIGLNIKDKELIYQINSFFDNKGRISFYHPHNEIRLTFDNLDVINNYIIPHFDSYPLFGTKFIDYQLFKMGINMIKNGDYKTSDGLRKFGEIALSMNEGYKKNRIEPLPGSIDITKNINSQNPLQHSGSLFDTISYPKDQKRLPSWWITGFIDGDGSLSASIKYKNLEKTRVAFQPSLTISQHKNNIILFNQIKEILNCGNVYNKKSSDGEYRHIQYQVSSNKDIKTYIIPHFEKYPLMSYKKYVYEIWTK
jgi:hypothetical protein